MEKAIFGAVCLWGVEAAFSALPGVTATAVGYAGGNTPNPTYKEVCTDLTGHCEVVYIEYDPEIIPYSDLLSLFWESHDPTTLNRQGPDVGSQYRSAIYTFTQQQYDEAVKSKRELEASGRFKRPIVTEVVMAPKFYKAEDYHQKYLAKRGLSSCHI